MHWPPWESHGNDLEEPRARSRGARSLIAGTMAVGIGAILALPSALPASAAPAAPETIRQIKGGTPLFDVGTQV